MATKLITSHMARVKKANELLKTDPDLKYEPISKIDREAFVEFFLLEDIRNLYNFRLKKEERYVPKGRTDEKAKALNIRKFASVISIFNAAIGAARGTMSSGDYTKVREAIHEHALKKAAANVKNLPQLKKLAIALLKELSTAYLDATKVNSDLDEELDDLEAHEANVRTVQGLPTEEELNEIIREIELAIPDEEPVNKKSRLIN